MHQETHPNPNEIFPIQGELGSPGGIAKAKLVAALAGSVATAVAIIAMLSLLVICTALGITATTAKIEIRLENWDKLPVTWNLTLRQEPQPGPVLQTGSLTRKLTILELQQLQPDTWYVLWFYQGENADPDDPVGRYCFHTGQGEPPETQPPQTEPPQTDPPETDPPETDPPETDPPETDPPETDPPQTDPPETDPPAALVPPTANNPVLLNYTSPSMEANGYTIRFTFQLNDAVPNRILISHGVTTYYNFDPEFGNQGPVQTEQVWLSQNYGPGEMELDEAANTVTVTYFAQGAYNGHNVAAVLDYTLQDADGNAAGTGSLTSPTWSGSPTYLYGQEAGSANTWTTAIRGDSIDVTLAIRDLRQGTWAYGLSQLNIYVDYYAWDGSYASYALADLITPPAIPGANGGQITYSFTVPLNPQGWDSPMEYIFFSMDASGDCLLNGAPMGLPSETFGYAELAFEIEEPPTDATEPYAFQVQAPTLAFSQAFTDQLRDMLGLEVGSLVLIDATTGAQGTTLENVSTGSTVYVYLYFNGTAATSGSLSPNVSAAGDITLPDLAACPITAGSNGCFFTFSFLMPDRDVTAGDIVISDLGIEIMGPPAGG